MKQYILKTKEDGSVITVRDVQLQLLDMMKDIDVLCQKHGISYWMTGGSALGAVRHQGFIPWDDDADIGMMREDYERFLNVVKELPAQYTVQSYETHKEYNVCTPAMKIRKKGTYVEEYNTLLKNKCKDCDGIFIDVFIVDYISENKLQDFAHRIYSCFLMGCIVLLENLHSNPIFLKNIFVNHAKRYGKQHRNSPLIGYDMTWCFNSPFHPVVYPKDTVFPLQYAAFEGELLPIPKDAHVMLDVEISVHHMSYPPKKDQRPKHIKDIELSDVRRQSNGAENNTENDTEQGSS